MAALLHLIVSRRNLLLVLLDRLRLHGELLSHTVQLFGHIPLVDLEVVVLLRQPAAERLHLSLQCTERLARSTLLTVVTLVDVAVEFLDQGLDPRESAAKRGRTRCIQKLGLGLALAFGRRQKFQEHGLLLRLVGLLRLPRGLGFLQRLLLPLLLRRRLGRRLSVLTCPVRRLLRDRRHPTQHNEREELLLQRALRRVDARLRVRFVEQLEARLELGHLHVFDGRHHALLVIDVGHAADRVEGAAEVLVLHADLHHGDGLGRAREANLAHLLDLLLGESNKALAPDAEPLRRHDLVARALGTDRAVADPLPRRGLRVHGARTRFVVRPQQDWHGVGPVWVALRARPCLRTFFRLVVRLHRYPGLILMLVRHADEVLRQKCALLEPRHEPRQARFEEVVEHLVV
mmetsp:Transcript_86623/g.245107  ORF Transcript_86623/g.245107 Transcript_86623/m.245107 type:complete len:403 (-) Transcript_86623:1734-2942(-)